MNGFPERYREAFARAEALFESINELPGLGVRKFENGSNIFELLLGLEIDAGRFVERLFDFDIVLPALNDDWPVPLLHVNATILRKTNDEIARAFSAAAGSSHPTPATPGGQEHAQKKQRNCRS